MRQLLKTLVLYAFHIGFARPVLIGIAGVRYRRRNSLPEGPCVVVSNHNSHLDAAVLMTAFPLRRIRRIHPVAAADYFGSSWFLKMWSMLFLNAIPFDRRPARGRDQMAPIVALLEAGETLIFFPEGSRGEAGVVARFRSGIGLLVQALPGLLVVPVFLSGPERIWPRGRLLPVPLNIDANIGKPRSYPADKDPREIAELVRRDVLSLAPPPPPLPGVRPRPPLRIAICSIDDERRRELHRETTARLGQLGKTLGVADSPLEADAEGLREAPAPIAGVRRAWPRLLATLFRTRGRFKGEHFGEMIERARIDEALDQGREARFVVLDGSALLDLMAWAEADFAHGSFDERGLGRLTQYLAEGKPIPVSKWWWFIRHVPEMWLVSVLHLARPPVPDVLVHVRAPVGDVMRRLRSRGRELQPYENESALERLQQAYRRVATTLHKRRRVELIEIEAEGAAADRVLEACVRLEETSRSA